MDELKMADSAAEDSALSHPLSPPLRNFRAESPDVTLSPRSPVSPRGSEKSSQNDSFPNFRSEDGYEAATDGRAAEENRSPAVPIEEKKGDEDNEGRFEEDASEAAFHAEAAAFARKDNTHELAVRRLVEDLVGNESEAAGETMVPGEEQEQEVGRGEGASATAGKAAMETGAEISSIKASADSSGKDLVEKESEAAKEMKPHGEEAEGRKGGKPAAGIPATETAAEVSSIKASAGSSSAKKRSNLMKTKAKDGKQQENKGHTPPQDAKAKRSPSSPAVKFEHTSPTEGKRRVHPIKDKEKLKEKSSPGSPSRGSPLSPRRIPGSPLSKTTSRSPLRPLVITPSEKMANSLSRTPHSKPSSQRMELSKLSPKSIAASMNVENKATQQSQSETDNVQQRVKELFQRRKSPIGFGSRKSVGLVGGDNESVVSNEHIDLLARDNPDLGPFLLKLAKQAVASGDNPLKALDFATRAAKSYETAANGKPSLDLVMSLHVLAAVHCTLGQFEEAIHVLEHSLSVPGIEGGGQEYALAVFSGNMQLGDTLALQGRCEDALTAYHTGLEVQRRALGEKDPRIGETCRYLAEAHAQAMQFDKAEELCQHSLDIHSEHSAPASIEEATDRRLMGLILNGKGQHESALEHLVLASMALIANGKDAEVAAVDTSIGDTYVCLGRFDEAVFAYQKALTVLKASKGENHVAVASVYVSLAELYLKTGKLRESRTYCESALRIYSKHGGHQLDEIASGLTAIAVVYEALNEQEQAISLLQKALIILETVPGQQSAVAGVEAQVGVLSYMCGKYSEARTSFSKAVLKLRASAEKNSSLLGIVLNQMGLSCVHLLEIKVAAEFFEESRNILEAACGPHHPDTLAVYSNLAGAYDALGRLDDAINTLQYVVEVREEELGTADPEVEDERNRLAELLKEAGRLRARRLNNTLELLMQSNSKPAIKSVACQNAAGAIVLVTGHTSSEVKVAANA